MTASLSNYNPATSLAAMFPTRTARQTERLWSTEKLIADANAAGFIDYFMGPGPNPMALSGASITKAWLRVDPDVTQNAGSLRVYQGSGDASDQANWPVMTPGRYFAHLRDNGPVSTEPSYVALASKASIATKEIDSAISYIYTAGYAVAGDGGEALYQRLSSAPGSPGLRHAESADGTWWELVVKGTVIVEQLGAKGDGATDDSAAFSEAISLGSGVVEARAGRVYRVKDLTLSSSDALRLNGAKLKAASGAKWIVRLTGFAPELSDGSVEDYERYCCRETTLATTVVSGVSSFVVASATGLEVGQWFAVMQDNDLPFASVITGVSGTTITTASACTYAITNGQRIVASWGMVNVQNSERALIDDVDFINTSVGIYLDRGSSSSYTCVRTSLRALRITDVYYAGICHGRDVAEVNKTDVRVRGGAVRTASYTGNGVTVDFAAATGSHFFLKRDAAVTVAGSAVAVSSFPDRFTVRLGSAPTNGSAVVVSNFYDAWFGVWVDETGWSTIRGGDVWVQTEILDCFFGLFMKAKELLTTVGMIVDTCQVGVKMLACLNQYHTSPFVGFCSRTIDLDGSSTGIHLSGNISTNLVPTSETVTGSVFGNIYLNSGSDIRLATHSWAQGVSGASRDIAGPGSVYLNICEVRDAATNAVQYASTLRHLITGTPANGVGVGQRYEVETSSGNVEIASDEVVCTDVTLGSEKFERRFYLPNGGDFRVNNDDELLLNGTKVHGTRVTGFTTAAGTANKDASGINVGTITASDANIRALAAWVKSLHDALASHGAIGA
jgi:hypothetical protein